MGPARTTPPSALPLVRTTRVIAATRPLTAALINLPDIRYVLARREFTPCRLGFAFYEKLVEQKRSVPINLHRLVVGRQQSIKVRRKRNRLNINHVIPKFAQFHVVCSTFFRSSPN